MNDFHGKSYFFSCTDHLRFMRNPQVWYLIPDFDQNENEEKRKASLSRCFSFCVTPEGF